MNRFQTPLLLTSVAAAALGPSASAQVADQGPNSSLFGNPIDRVYQYALPATSKTFLATGEVTDDRVIDVLTVLNGKPYILGGPAYTDLPVDLGLPPGHSPATSIVAKPSSTSPVAKIVVSSSGGLVEYARNNSLGTYSYSAVPGSAAWAGASQLLVADVHPAPGDELIGFFHVPNGDSVIRIARLDAAGFAERASQAVAGDAISLHVVDRYAYSSRMELAVVSPLGATYWAFQSGTGLMMVDLNVWSDPATCAVAIDDDRGSGLAVAHTASNNLSSLGVYRESGVEPLLPLRLGIVNDMVAATGVVTPWTDIVLRSNDVHVLRNISHGTGASFVFHGGYPTNRLGAALSGDPVAGLTIADFDGDGDVDIFAQSKSGDGQIRTGFCHMNPRVKPAVMSPLIKRPDHAAPEDEVTVSHGTTPQTARLRTRVHNMEAVRAAGFTHLDIELWVAGHGENIQRRLVPVPPTSPIYEVDTAMPMGGTLFGVGQRSVFFVRGVTLTPDRALDTVGPAMRFGVNMWEVEAVLNGDFLGTIPPEDDPDPPQGQGDTPVT